MSFSFNFSSGLTNSSIDAYLSKIDTTFEIFIHLPGALDIYNRKNAKINDFFHRLDILLQIAPYIKNSSKKNDINMVLSLFNSQNQTILKEFSTNLEFFDTFIIIIENDIDDPLAYFKTGIVTQILQRSLSFYSSDTFRLFLNSENFMKTIFKNIEYRSIYSVASSLIATLDFIEHSEILALYQNLTQLTTNNGDDLGWSIDHIGVKNLIEAKLPYRTSIINLFIEFVEINNENSKCVCDFFMSQITELYDLSKTNEEKISILKLAIAINSNVFQNTVMNEIKAMKALNNRFSEVLLQYLAKFPPDCFDDIVSIIKLMVMDPEPINICTNHMIDLVKRFQNKDIKSSKYLKDLQQTFKDSWNNIINGKLKASDNQKLRFSLILEICDLLNLSAILDSWQGFNEGILKKFNIIKNGNSEIQEKDIIFDEYFVFPAEIKDSNSLKIVLVNKIPQRAQSTEDTPDSKFHPELSYLRDVKLNGPTKKLKPKIIPINVYPVFRTLSEGDSSRINMKPDIRISIPMRSNSGKV